MKRKSLLIMLLAAFFVPLAMNAQTRSLHSPKLDKLEMNSAVARENAQNGMLKKSTVQFPNLESRNFNTLVSSNAMSRGTRDVQYELVSSELTDWSGNYIVGLDGSTLVYAFDGDVYDTQSDYGSNTGGFASVGQSSGTIADAGDAAILTFTAVDGADGWYTITVNGQYYLGSNPTEGLVMSSSLSSYDYFWTVYWYSNSNVPILFSYSDYDDDNAYGLTFFIGTDSEGSWGGFCTYELSDDATEFEYYYAKLYKETTSGGGNTDCDYEKVTASQSDWSGDYVITYVSGTTAYVLTGKNANGNYGAYTTATITNNLLANADVAAYNVTIEPVTYNNQTKYTLKIGNTYLGYTSTSTSGSNYLYFTESIPSSNPQRYYWTIAYSNNTVTLTSVYNTRRVLKWNSSQPRFACYTSGQNAITLFKKLTDCAPACPVPTNLTYSNVTGDGATLAWDGEADSYNILIGPAPKTYGFEDGTLQGWTAYDADGDGYSWNASNSTSSSGATYYHSGTYYAMASYNESAAVDNWLISPQIQLGGSISFWVRRLSTSWTDSYRVYVSTTNTDISSFREISSGTITPGTSYTQASYPLSSYSGMGYVAIRHTAAADQAYVFVDDITIVEGGQTIPNVTSPYTVTGLDYATEYVWQVQGDCGDGALSQWSTSSTFTTLDLCAAPTGLSSADITNNSAALSWTGLADTYNIQYREFDPTAPATLILNVPTDIWNDGTGYQLVLDADHNTYGTTIPETANFTAGTFADFEYTIPENAVCNASTNTIVVNGSATITIPAGVYDYVFLNPDPTSGTYYIASSNGFSSRGDDFEFMAGTTYEFTLSLVGQNDYITLTTTANWTPVSGTVTSPYTLTGLNPGTTYEWQVKGDGCDDWSAGNTFTTLNGILVETISAANIDMVVGQTTTITPTILPTDATNQAVTYTSDDETVATVGENNGLVTAVGPGTATITIAATDGSGVTGTCTVTVNPILVGSITASDITVVNGQTAQISYQVDPTTATDPSVTFTSADPTIATVDATTGEVTGVSVGTTTITIAANDASGVSTTIEVTVTPNPNAVQFTVNAPANAAPGEVITVEAVLTAPTNGTYEGFTDLLMRIFYDNTAFEYVANSMVYGPVATQAQQYGSQLTPNTTYIANAIQLGINCYDEGVFVTADGVVFSAQFTVLEGTEGSFTFTAQPKDELNFDHEGVSIPYEVTPSTVVVAEPVIEHYYKDIVGWQTPEGTTTNFYLIASPLMEAVAPTDVHIYGADDNTTMVSGSFDLYYFDHAQANEWINYKAEVNGNNITVNPNFGNLTPGKGFLYANINTVRLDFAGTGRTSGTFNVPLAYTSGGTGIDLPGWNLVGNPFTVNAWLVGNRSFYTMTVDGRFEAVTNASINPMEGVFVVATGANQSVTFTTEESSKSSTLALNLSNGRNLIDRAIVRFDGGDQLPKLQFRQGSTKVYIPVEGQDYAVVNCEEMGAIPVNFKAEENGRYNLSLSTEEVSFAYLHLIDNMTGADIDLLQTPSYSFEAKTTDYSQRFKLVFATGDNSNDDNFAFFSNGSFIINNDGEATLQVIDVTGRILSSESINGCTNVNVNAASGVYMLRLINGDNVKVQKVVVK